MVKVTSLLVKAGSGLRFSFGVRTWTGMEIRHVKGMYRLKLVSSRNNPVFKGSRGKVFQASLLFVGSELEKLPWAEDLKVAHELSIPQENAASWQS